MGNLNVHYSSGPNNHMFYLLSHGGTSKCNGAVVAGIGNDKAAANLVQGDFRLHDGVDQLRGRADGGR